MHKFGSFVVYSRRKAHKNIITASAGDARSLPNERLVPAAAGVILISMVPLALSLSHSVPLRQQHHHMNDEYFNVL